MSDLYYKLKWSIENFFKYFRIVSRMRPWDFNYLLEMFQFQLKLLKEYIEKYGIEIDKTRLQKVERMEKVIELLDNFLKDDYSERCGYNCKAYKINFVKLPNKELYEMVRKKQLGFKDYDENKIFKNSYKLEEKEWNELFDILKSDLKGWWD